LRLLSELAPACPPSPGRASASLTSTRSCPPSGPSSHSSPTITVKWSRPGRRGAGMRTGRAAACGVGRAVRAAGRGGRV